MFLTFVSGSNLSGGDCAQKRHSWTFGSRVQRGSMYDRFWIRNRRLLFFCHSGRVWWEIEGIVNFYLMWVKFNSILTTLWALEKFLLLACPVLLLSECFSQCYWVCLDSDSPSARPKIGCSNNSKSSSSGSKSSSGRRGWKHCQKEPEVTNRLYSLFCTKSIPSSSVAELKNQWTFAEVGQQVNICKVRRRHKRKALELVELATINQHTSFICFLFMILFLFFSVFFLAWCIDKSLLNT